DDMNVQGRTKLALRIDEAQMKDGGTKPVRAYIVGLFPASGGAEEQAQAYTPGNQDPNPWRKGIKMVDQIDALNGVDLHSKIGDNNSAVLVSKKSDIKLKAGTELALVISEGDGNGSSGQAGSNHGGR
ncbi:MAG TPA: hypothetical protein VHA37_09790, partial [Candidatus Saccharimonadales bacterium]|nr:hypothetical protein [Candidatus Saccharimonadales bacterium]